MSLWPFLSALVATLAVVSACIADSWTSAVLIFVVLYVFCCLLGLGPTRVYAHGRRVLVRSWFSEEVNLRQGSFWLWFPEYVVRDSRQFGPWADRKELPMPGQTIELDVPDAMVPVDGGMYTFKVNTKVVGCVEDYSVTDLAMNPVPIENRMHDVIANALRKAVHDKPVEAALGEIQQILSQDHDGIAALLATPTFRAKWLMVDADQSIVPANEATKRAVDLVAQRKQEAMRRAVQEEAHVTAMCEMQNRLLLKAEEQKLHALELQMRREDLMLQKEAYGPEGAAQIEAAKQAKASYVFSGGGHGVSTWTTLPGS